MSTLTQLSAAAAGLALIAACGAAEGPAAAHNHEEPAAATETAAPADPAAEAAAETLADVAAGDYSLDRNHAFLGFYVGHAGGISKYRAGFGDFDADLTFDPEAPENSTLSVRINAQDLLVHYPGDYKATHADSEFESWEDDLTNNDRWFNADTYPEITFDSTSVTRTGPNTGEVTGDLTFLGETRPVTLDVTYNGLANAPWAPDQDIIGFTASTTIKRADFGMDALIPWIGEDVKVTFSGEFKQDM